MTSDWQPISTAWLQLASLIGRRLSGKYNRTLSSVILRMLFCVLLLCIETLSGRLVIANPERVPRSRESPQVQRTCLDRQRCLNPIDSHTAALFDRCLHNDLTVSFVVVAKVERTDGGDMAVIGSQHEFTGGKDVVATSCVARWWCVLELPRYAGPDECTRGEEGRSLCGGDGEGPVVVLGQDATMPVDDTAERAAHADDASCSIETRVRRRLNN
jgi:hypothetical protein